MWLNSYCPRHSSLFKVEARPVLPLLTAAPHSTPQRLPIAFKIRSRLLRGLQDPADLIHVGLSDFFSSAFSHTVPLFYHTGIQLPLNIPGSFLPQDLCTSYLLSLECPRSRFLCGWLLLIPHISSSERVC